MIATITVIAIVSLIGYALYYSFKDKNNRPKGGTGGGNPEKDDNNHIKNVR